MYSARRFVLPACFLYAMTSQLSFIYVKKFSDVGFPNLIPSLLCKQHLSTRPLYKQLDYIAIYIIFIDISRCSFHFTHAFD